VKILVGFICFAFSSGDVTVPIALPGVIKGGGWITMV
jgi:hypothetical protein